MKLSLYVTRHGLVPDALVRYKIRRLLRHRLNEEKRNYSNPLYPQLILNKMRTAPIAIETVAANEQHYEVPAEFFTYVLGKNMKYSSCYWAEHCNNLNKAEEEALRITCQRAAIQSGLKILELGCGWGSLSIYMAQKFPACKITGVSNSSTQKIYIEQKCKELGIDNLNIITADMNVFDTTDKFDRIVSVEMFEHIRNWEALLQKIHAWLKDDGKFFMHIFTHAQYTYFFEVRDETDWMAEYFFTGGLMPANKLLSTFNKDMVIEDNWIWNGKHYEKTANAWLQNMDMYKKEILNIFKTAYPAYEAQTWWNYWRIFFMACAELWAFNNGDEWMVSHYMLHKK